MFALFKKTYQQGINQSIEIITIAAESKLLAQMNAPQGSISQRRDLLSSMMKGWRKLTHSS
jgi:hypothetical protein